MASNVYDVDLQDNKTVRVVCEWAGITLVRDQVCDPLEKEAWLAEKARKARLAAFMDSMQKLPPFLRKPLPIVKKGVGLSGRHAETVTDLAYRYSAEESDLAAVLAPAQGKDVTLLDPSPYGKASFLFVDDKGLRNTTTILRSGNIVTTKTAK